MANRPVFYFDQNMVKKDNVEFEWFPGFSVAQKQRSIDSLHQAVCVRHPGAAPLEVSTKSKDALGCRLSAFNLKIGGHYLENVFQSAKVFACGGPFPDLLTVPPKEAKRDGRLRESGRLRAFRYLDRDWPLSPQTAFYDYLYYQAVRETLGPEELEALRAFTCFTDIEFNPNRSINTQARSAAMVRLILEMYHELIEIDDVDQFIRFHQSFVVG